MKGYSRFFHIAGHVTKPFYTYALHNAAIMWTAGAVYFVFGLCIQVNAQEWLGIVNSNFSGNVGLQLNPSNVVGAPFQREILFFGADIAGHNNYLHLRQGSTIPGAAIKGELNKKVISDSYTPLPNKQGGYNLAIKGPGVMHSNNANGVAFNIGYRQILSAENINTHLAKFMLEGFDYQPQHMIYYNTDGYKVNFLSFYEGAFTYGRGVWSTNEHYLSAGITVSVYAGNSAFYVDSRNMDYNVPISQLLIIENVNLHYGYAFTRGTPSVSDFAKVRGWGGGVSAGLNYINARNDKAYKDRNSHQRKYNYKLGLSMVDVGLIKFGKESNTFSFENDSVSWFGIDTTKFGLLAYNDSLLGQKLTGNANGAYTGDKFNMWLPSAVSVQFDKHLVGNMYANISVIQAITLQNIQVRRTSQLSASVRYETRSWELTVPYSYINYYRHRVGLAIRWQIFFIGTDRLGAFTGLSQTDGLDIFFGFKWANNNNKRSGKRGEDCFIFK